jgi:proteasome lid subunit RPN8/RPN11
MWMTKRADAQVIISNEARQALFADIYQRATIEACGVLLGTLDEEGNWHVEQAHSLRNIFASPVYFEFDPEELLGVELAYPGQIIGAYHSHPSGFLRASSTDRGNMRRVNQEQEIPWVWLIVSGPFKQTQATDERITAAPMIAYHHYPHNGLHTVSIQFEDVQ